MLSSRGSEVNVATIHGLRLHSPFEIWPGATTAKREWSHQITVNLSANSTTTPELTGELVAESVEQGERMYAFARLGTRTEFTFPRLCHGWFDLQLGLMNLYSDDPGMAGLVLPNTILAAVLGSLGDLTLHGSAVHFNGSTLAFCGPSTAGKTTCAAAAVMHGAAAVTDDLLRVDMSVEGTPICFPGIPEFRLRTTHGWRLPEGQVRTLVDERTGFTPADILNHRSPLRAIIFPVASDEGVAPSMRRIQGQPAIRRLLQSSRIAWTPRGAPGFLRQLSALATRVELFELHLHLGSLRDVAYREQFAEALGKVV